MLCSSGKQCDQNFVKYRMSAGFVRPYQADDDSRSISASSLTESLDPTSIGSGTAAAAATAGQIGYSDDGIDPTLEKLGASAAVASQGGTPMERVLETVGQLATAQVWRCQGALFECPSLASTHLLVPSRSGGARAARGTRYCQP